jgi:hypothetical protein
LAFRLARFWPSPKPTSVNAFLPLAPLPTVVLILSAEPLLLAVAVEGGRFMRALREAL